ncbi:MAG: hypothetical protein HY721_23275 [Planctomycetes bacterium]|nr:hypothetical protein [Planctomycetota bacterium]
MPILSITRRERRLPGTVNDTISRSHSVSKPKADGAIHVQVLDPRDALTKRKGKGVRPAGRRAGK